MTSIKKHYESAWKAIIEPMKLEYSETDLGPDQFLISQNMIKRLDFTLTNKHSNVLACSFFENTTITTPIPCVIYLHANGSCRLEALQYKQVILASKVHYFCFDFTACGKSTGQYGSVGHYEQDDLERVINFLMESKKVTKIALWGRSMGAVTAILYTSKNPNISCIILDSPFSKFKRLVKELVKNKANVPTLIIEMVLAMIKKTVKKKANFDVTQLKPIESIKTVETPALFGAPRHDSFVSPQHTKDLYMAHNGVKKLATFEGDHNSQRPLDWVISVLDFLKVHLSLYEEASPGVGPKKIFDDPLKYKQPEWTKPSFAKIEIGADKDI